MFDCSAATIFQCLANRVRLLANEAPALRIPIDNAFKGRIVIHRSSSSGRSWLTASLGLIPARASQWCRVTQEPFVYVPFVLGNVGHCEISTEKNEPTTWKTSASFSLSYPTKPNLA